MEEINTVTPQQIEILRNSFHDKVQAESVVFHPDDLERVKTDELWMRRFVAHAEFNLTTALDLLYNCCLWRKEFGANDLDETKIPSHLLEQGTIFIRNRDKWGKKLLIFKSKLYTKGTVDFEVQKLLLVYYFERIERESNSDQITIIFDMKDTGWSNMDMDFTRYLITLLKTYYPYFVNYLIIYEMPWLLNAAWKIIKGWLPPKSVDIVKFQDKKNLKEFIDVDNQLAEWGGTDNYVYKFEPAPQTNFKFKRMQNNNNNSDFNGVPPGTEAKHRETPTTPIASPIPNSTETTFTFTKSQDNCLADVEDRITFRANESDDLTYTAQLTIKNTSPNGDPLIVKIKTTSPERYRVKPVIFVLNSNARGAVSIETHLGVSASTMSRDQFHVQVAILPPDKNMSPSTTKNLNDLGNDFRQIITSGIPVETYKMAVSVEARAGDTGAGQAIALNDEGLRRGLDELEKKLTESVAKGVTAQVDQAKRMLLILLGAIAFLLCSILTYLVKMEGDWSNSCQGSTLRMTLSQGVVNTGNEAVMV